MLSTESSVLKFCRSCSLSVGNMSEQLKNPSRTESRVIPFACPSPAIRAMPSHSRSSASEFASGTRSPERYRLSVAAERPEASLRAFAVHCSVWMYSFSFS